MGLSVAGYVWEAKKVVLSEEQKAEAKAKAKARGTKEPVKVVADRQISMSDLLDNTRHGIGELTSKTVVQGAKRVIRVNERVGDGSFRPRLVTAEDTRTGTPITIMGAQQAMGIARFLYNVFANEGVAVTVHCAYTGKVYGDNSQHILSRYGTLRSADIEKYIVAHHAGLTLERYRERERLMLEAGLRLAPMESEGEGNNTLPSGNTEAIPATFTEETVPDEKEEETTEDIAQIEEVPVKQSTGRQRNKKK